MTCQLAPAPARPNSFRVIVSLSVIVCAAFLSVSFANDSLEVPHALNLPLKMARASLQHSRANVDDYTAILIKRLRINGKLGERQFIDVKIRNRKMDGDKIVTPMAVYLKFLRPQSSKGREVIWVEGRNNGRMVAHDVGLKNFIRVSLDPTGFIAMRGQKYPITDIGLHNLCEKVVSTAERDREHGDCDVRVFENAKVGGSECRMVQVVHTEPKPPFDFYQARVYFDISLNLPIRYASWSWPAKEGDKPPLEEEYTYTNVKTNVGLTDSDFDPDNSKYDFP